MKIHQKQKGKRRRRERVKKELYMWGKFDQSTLHA
jgi:hypothetical protein